MGFKVAVILTTYNRPTLVVDAIESVFEQSEPCRLYIMDDGSNEESRRAIWEAVGKRSIFYPPTCASPATVVDLTGGRSEVAWWMGPGRSSEERKATISYSRSINFALNYLVHEPYICYLVDDDYLYPDSALVRAGALDAHPDWHVAYGRLRAVQYELDGRFNAWGAARPPSSGRHYPVPTGQWQPGTRDKGGRYYFSYGATDPETGLPYVEEGFWKPGALVYGHEGMVDHNQVMHRSQCLRDCAVRWLGGPADLGGVQYWGENMRWRVGDYAFFTVLGMNHAHRFHAVDAWVATKRYHSFSDGLTAGERRE